MIPCECCETAGVYGRHCNCYTVHNDMWNFSLLAILQSIKRCFLPSKNLKNHSLLIEHSMQQVETVVHSYQEEVFRQKF